ncbi:hypothetical protein ATL40_2812 [Serinibacter salmoneus]|uniref:Uncharacterized protein n=1 Tax=Serinibacter salmoneus TaxID=556530 RepID=A0A2A9D5R0_9MICO|nr:hypothetical protein ATL40_2812 [Serinibacter salmoneus]
MGRVSPTAAAAARAGRPAPLVATGYGGPERRLTTVGIAWKARRPGRERSARKWFGVGSVRLHSRRLRGRVGSDYLNRQQRKSGGHLRRRASELRCDPLDPHRGVQAPSDGLQHSLLLCDVAEPTQRGLAGQRERRVAQYEHVSIVRRQHSSRLRVVKAGDLDGVVGHVDVEDIEAQLNDRRRVALRPCPPQLCPALGSGARPEVGRLPQVRIVRDTVIHADALGRPVPDSVHPHVRPDCARRQVEKVWRRWPVDLGLPGVLIGGGQDYPACVSRGIAPARDTFAVTDRVKSHGLPGQRWSWHPILGCLLPQAD